MGDVNQEPSMEDILASIKRVIAEDNRSATPRPQRRAPTADAVPSPAAPESAASEDVLELSDPIEADKGLISQDAALASRQALSSLAAMRQQAGPAPAPAPAVSDAPLEAVVRELLKPMLKEWLDQRLPEIVEELVTREIARITTGER
jgi:uncharacterized protein